MSRFNRKHARHEASHALIGWLLGLLIQRVSIVGPVRGVADERNSPFHCQLKGPAMVALNQLSPADIITRVHVHLGPYVLEDKKKNGPSYGALWDVKEGMDVLLWGDQKDLRSLVEAAREARKNHDGNWEERAEEFAKKCSGPVKELMGSPNAKRCLNALVDVLMQRGTLSGYEVASLFEDNWQGVLPSRARPRSEHSTGLAGTSPEDSLEAALRLTRMILEILKEHDHEDQRCERAAEEFLKMLFWLSNLA